MLILACIAAVSALILLLILLIQVDVSLLLRFSSHPFSVRLEAQALRGIIKYRGNLSEKSLRVLFRRVPGAEESLGPEQIKSIAELLMRMKQRFDAELQKIPEVSSASKRVGRALRVNKLRLSVSVGGDNPATVAQVVGALWGLSGFMLVLARLSRRFPDNEPRFRFVPSFGKAGWRLLLESAFSAPLRLVLASSLRYWWLSRKQPLPLERAHMTAGAFHKR